MYTNEVRTRLDPLFTLTELILFPESPTQECNSCPRTQTIVPSHVVERVPTLGPDGHTVPWLWGCVYLPFQTQFWVSQVTLHQCGTCTGWLVGWSLDTTLIDDSSCKISNRSPPHVYLQMNETLLLFFIIVKWELKRVYINGCRYNERLNAETEGSITPRIHWDVGIMRD